MSDTHSVPRQQGAGSSAIRRCEPGDLSIVSELFAQSFGGGDFDEADWLEPYLRQVYFDNPWVDESMASLVYEQKGEIDGFLGVVPRQMTFRGRSIRVAVNSALMVRPDASGKRNPIVAIGLLRRLLAGPQDLSLTDTANELSRRIWTGCGGSVAHAYSYSWARPLQPLRTCLELAGSGDRSFAMKVAKPICRLADPFLGNLRRIRPARPEYGIEDIDCSALLELLTTVSGSSLVPEYDLASLEWLIAMAEQSVGEGRLAKRCVRDAGGRLLGWYIYYQNKNGIGRVLQVATLDHSMAAVLSCLVYEAKQAGVAVLWGRTEPQHAASLNEQNCVFFARPWVLVHAARAELVAAFQNADTFFSGLEGELWMRVNA